MEEKQSIFQERKELFAQMGTIVDRRLVSYQADLIIDIEGVNESLDTNPETVLVWAIRDTGTNLFPLKNINLKDEDTRNVTRTMIDINKTFFLIVDNHLIELTKEAMKEMRLPFD